MNRSFEKHDKVKFIKEFINGSYRHAIKAAVGSTGIIGESYNGVTKVTLSSGKYVRIQNEMLYHYLKPANLSLSDSLSEALSPEKQRVARELDSQSTDLDKLSKLVKRTWSAPSRRKVEQEVEKEIKKLMSLKRLIQGVKWDE